MEKPPTRSKRSKWIVIGSVLALLGLVIIGVVVGVVVSKNNKKTSGGAKKGDSSGPAVVNQTDPHDPSTFVKDSRLKQSMYGMAYTPENSQLPGCGNKLEDVIKDVQIMSQLTKRIRLYGADCNQSALVLEAIKQTKVDLSVFLGIYPIPDDNTAYTRQRDAVKEALTTYGADHVAGLTVGNEFMLNYLTAHHTQDPNSDVGNTGAATLIANIQDAQSMLSSLNLGKTIPIGNSDAGSFFNTKVLEAVSYGLANVHPWFANVTVETAAAWTAQFFDQTNVQPANQLSNKPKMYIAETGWPTKSSDAGNANNGASPASEAGLQTFLDTFVCQANQNGTGYFFFEYSDELWKDKQFGGVEGWWGLFNGNRTLKNIKIPDCQAP
jgi:exo-beta-1,3-glucanase (GH17 family)